MILGLAWEGFSPKHHWKWSGTKMSHPPGLQEWGLHKPTADRSKLSGQRLPCHVSCPTRTPCSALVSGLPPGSLACQFRIPAHQFLAPDSSSTTLSLFTRWPTFTTHKPYTLYQNVFMYKIEFRMWCNSSLKKFKVMGHFPNLILKKSAQFFHNFFITQPPTEVLQHYIVIWDAPNPTSHLTLNNS